MNRLPVLIIDDEPDLRELLCMTLEKFGYAPDQASNYQEALEKLDTQHYSLCLTDMRLPDGNGLDIISHIQAKENPIPVAMLSAHGNMDSAIEALKRGAFDFVNKPIDLNQLRVLVSSAVKLPQPASEETIEAGSSRLIGTSQTACELRKKLIKVARSQAPVFIRGESGSGKEVCARLIHEHSSRKEGPFIAINCGAIPGELVESEFFGHKKGAFTGAISDEPGLFLSANGGSLLLDEVADLPLSMQVKLLRAIQEKRIKPVGGQQEIDIDVRILSATHKDLSQLVRDNLFRNDLFYRINVIEVNVPPLRQRHEDIAPIAEKILLRISDEMGLPPVHLTSDALQKLQAYEFPGNIRELENTLERTVALCESSEISESDLIFQLFDTPTGQSEPAKSVASTDSESESYFDPSASTLDEYLNTIERQEIESALVKNRWNKTETAKYLGITFRSLRYRLKKLRLDD